jgi:putative membrane protein
MGLAFPNRTLSARALANRGLSAAAPGRAASVAAPAASSAREGKSVLAWLQEFSRNGPEPSIGKDVDVIGFVYRDARTPADQFWVARYTLACCVADASGIGMVVRGFSQGAALEEGSWVRVRGKIALGELNGEKLPVIVAEAVEPTAEPAQPYLFQ